MRPTRWNRKRYWCDEDIVNERALRRQEADEEIRQAELDHQDDVEEAADLAEQQAADRRYEELLWDAWEMSF